MRIVVLNGSPKGSLSVTYQYILYLQKKYQNIEFKIHNVASRIKTIEHDENLLNEIINDVEECDGVIWSFPVYFMCISSQYKRFIELIFERNFKHVFKNKYTISISTSINFFDHTSHNYINEICDDLDMNFVGLYSAETHDLLKEKERERFKKFFEMFCQNINEKKYTIKNNPPIISTNNVFIENEVTQINTKGKRILIVVDELKNDNLTRMILRLQKTFNPPPEISVLKRLDIKGGCVGCIKCGIENHCVYENVDGFIDFYKNKFLKADILFMCGSIHDRYLSSLWKCFFDRSFYNGHIPILKGKQVGIIISGPLNQISNLKEILKAYSSMQEYDLLGFISDDIGDSEQINESIQTIAENAIINSRLDYISPRMFYQVSGVKLLRDSFFGKLRPVFQADHNYYKKYKMYNFPTKNYKYRIINSLLVLILKIPVIRKKFVRLLKPGMIEPFTKLLKRNDI